MAVLAFFCTFALFQTVMFARTTFTLPYSNTELLDRATDAIVRDIARVQKEEGYTEPNFFHVYGRQYFGEAFWNTVLLLPLEQKMGYDLMAFDQSVFVNDIYIQKNRDTYAYLACYSTKFHYLTKDCIDSFKAKWVYPQATLVRQVYAEDKLEVLLMETRR